MPWNDPDNLELAGQIPDEFTSQGLEYGHTRVSGIVSIDTLWPETARRRIEDVQSGTSYTIAVVESPAMSFHWMEPTDLSLRDLLREVSSGNTKLLAGFIDGHVDVLKNCNQDYLQKLLTI